VSSSDSAMSLGRSSNTQNGHRPTFRSGRTFEVSRQAQQSYLHRLVKNPGFEAFWAFAIITNALLVGVEVHIQSVAPVGSERLGAFRVLDVVYSCAFLSELLLRISADRLYFFIGASRAWNWFVVETIFQFTLDRSKVTDGNTSSMRLFRLLRTVRFVRVFRLVRMVRFVRALRTLVFSIACTLRALFWALVLLVMILYLFAVLFTQAVADHTGQLGERPISFTTYWGSIPRSMLTLFQCVSNGISWEIAAQPLESVGLLWLVLFVMYICFVFFAVLNVVTGVFCQSAMEGAMHDAEIQVQETLKNKQEFIEKAQRLFRNLDCDQSGGVTMKELEEHMDDEVMLAYFDTLGIEMDDAWTLFKLLTSEEGDVVSCDDFVMGCMRLKGQARSMDIARVMYDQKVLREKISKLSRSVQHDLGALRLGVAAIQKAIGDNTRSSVFLQL